MFTTFEFNDIDFVVSAVFQYFRCNTRTIKVRRADIDIIAISHKGIIRVSSGEEMSLPLDTPAELHIFVANILRQRPGLPFRLIIDQRVPYKQVAEVFATLAEHGVERVYLEVEQRTKPIDPELQRFFATLAGDRALDAKNHCSGRIVNDSPFRRKLLNFAVTSTTATHPTSILAGGM